MVRVTMPSLGFNNADVYGAIDKDGNEVIPFSYNIRGFNGADGDLLNESVNSLGGLSYVINSEFEKTAQHLDVKTMETYSDPIIHIGDFNINSFTYSYRCDAGIFYYYKGVFDENFEPLNCTFPAQSLKGVRDVKQFFNEGIIPVMREDNAGYTFAIISR